MSLRCGRFYKEEFLNDDPVNQTGSLLKSTACAALSGISKMPCGKVSKRYVMVDRSQMPTVEPKEAFAYMVAMSLADYVWWDTFGYRLTAPNHQPRNAYQREMLQRLANVFAESGPLKALLTEIATSLYFNHRHLQNAVIPLAPTTWLRCSMRGR